MGNDLINLVTPLPPPRRRVIYSLTAKACKARTRHIQLIHQGMEI